MNYRAHIPFFKRVVGKRKKYEIMKIIKPLSTNLFLSLLWPDRLTNKPNKLYTGSALVWGAFTKNSNVWLE